MDKKLVIKVGIQTRAFGYERVHLPFYKVADAPFHTQGDDFLGCFSLWRKSFQISLNLNIKHVNQGEIINGQ